MMHADPVIHDLEIMSRANNYRAWIFSHFSRHTGQRIIEIGAGIGNFTRLFADRELVIAVDTHEACIEYLKKRFSDHNNIVSLKGDIADTELLKLCEYKPDTVVCINVLEHVQDDMAALSNMFHLLGHGGRLALLVPAYQFLFGSIDRVVGHCRRYNKNELAKKLASAGFTIEDLFYMNSVGVLGWFLNNRILEKEKESPSQVMVFDKLFVPWLRYAENIFRPPFGLSLVAVAKKVKT